VAYRLWPHRLQRVFRLPAKPRWCGGQIRLSRLAYSVSAFLAVAAKEPEAFCWSSRTRRADWRYTFLGCRPYMQIVPRGSSHGAAGEQRQVLKGNIFDIVKEQFRKHVRGRAGSAPFAAGAVGYFAYDAVRAWKTSPACEGRCSSRLRADVFRSPAGF